MDDEAFITDAKLGLRKYFVFINNIEYTLGVDKLI